MRTENEKLGMETYVAATCVVKKKYYHELGCAMQVRIVKS